MRPTIQTGATRDPLLTASTPAQGEPLDNRSLELLKHITAPPIDAEFQEWKKARKRHSGLPWRQLSLMASVCFGVASLVLPDSVSDTLDWVLYGLMAASAYAGLSRRWSMASND